MVRPLFLISLGLTGCTADCPKGFEAKDDGNCYAAYPDDPAKDSGGDPGDSGDPDTDPPWTGDFELGDPINFVESREAKNNDGEGLVEWVDAEVIADGAYGFMVGQGGIGVMDLDDSSMVAIEGTDRGYRTDVDGTFAIVGTRERGVFTVDLSDPTAPQIGPRDQGNSYGYHEDVSTSDGLVLVGWRDDGGILLDTDLNEVGKIPADDAFAVGLHGDRATLTDGTTLGLWDVSDPATPVQLDSLTMATEGRDISFDGTHVAVGLGGHGVAVYKVVNDQLVEHGSLEVPGSSLSVSLDGNFLWIGAWEVAALAYLGGPEAVMLGHEKGARSVMALGAGGNRAAIADWTYQTVMSVNLGVAGPELVVEDTLWFPETATEDDAQFLRVSNGGLFPLEVDLGEGSEGYTIEGGALTLQPGEKASVLITPPASPPEDVRIDYSSNDPDESQPSLFLKRAGDVLGQQHPDFTMQGFAWPENELADYTLSEQQGKVVYLVYWALF